MFMKIDKKLILSEIKSELGFKRDAEFARFLGIKPQTLSSWYSRNTYDTELVYSKCRFLNAEWLLTGEGEMRKRSTDISEQEEISHSKEYSEGYWRGRYDELLEKHKELLQEVSHIKSDSTTPSKPDAGGMA